MSRISAATIDRVRESADIVEVVAAAVSLKPRGHEFWACCPFHEEHTPSFHVRPDRQYFHCFGCGAGGNVFDFVMRTQGLNFPEAVRELARIKGIVVETEGPDDAGDRREERARLERLYQAVEAAAKFYADCLLRQPSGEEGRAYLAGRRFHLDAARAFGLGYAPGHGVLVAHLSAQGFQREELLESGLAQEHGGRLVDFFFRRVLFPIEDPRGRVVAFSGRTIDTGHVHVQVQRKYVNTQQTPLYHKGELLYALHRAIPGMRRTGHALVMEGATDVLAAHQAGFAQAVGTLGTALTEAHGRLLRRHTDRVYAVFDGDQAGRSATVKCLGALLPLGLEVRCLTLPDELDPFDLFGLEGGAQRFQEALDGAQDFAPVLLSWARKAHDLTSISGQLAAADEVLASIALLPDPLARRRRIEQVATYLGLEDQVDTLQRRLPAIVRNTSPPAPEDNSWSGWSSLDGLSLRVALAHPELRARLFAELGPKDLDSPAARCCYERLREVCALSPAIAAGALLDQVRDLPQADALGRLLAPLRHLTDGRTPADTLEEILATVARRRTGKRREQELKRELAEDRDPYGMESLMGIYRQAQLLRTPQGEIVSKEGQA